MIGTISQRGLRASLAALALASSLFASADNVTIEGVVYSTNSDFTASVSGRDAATFPADVVIQGRFEYNGAEYKVTRIGERRFYGVSGMRSITIPGSVSYIGQYCFQGCSDLQSVTFEASEDGLVLDNFSFEGCKLLTDVILPEGMTAINRCVFSSCVSLARINLPESLQSIGEHSFYNCTSLPSVLVIPDNVTSIGASAYVGCTSLTDVVLPAGLTTSPKSAFSTLTGLKKAAYPSSIENPFPSSVTAISYPADDVLIEDGCVWSAAKDKLLYVPTTTAGEFRIPNTVTVMRFSALTGCDLIEKLIVEDGTTSFSPMQDCAMPTLSSYKELYLGRSLNNPYFTQMGNPTKIYVGNLVKEIPYGAFLGKSVEEVKFGTSLTRIPMNAFKGCCLTEVVIPSSVTTIMENAFYGNMLTKVSIGSGITTIGKDAFKENEDLREFHISAVELPGVTVGDDKSLFSTNWITVHRPKGSTAATTSETMLWNDYQWGELVAAESIELTRVESMKTMAAEDDGEDTERFYTLTAKVMPEDATLKHVFWSSSNPEVATVDLDGNVTVHDPSGEYKITASTLYADGPTADYPSESRPTGIDGIMEDMRGAWDDATGLQTEKPNHVYNIQGMLIKRNATQSDVDALPAGLYIVGGRKLLVR